MPTGNPQHRPKNKTGVEERIREWCDQVGGEYQTKMGGEVYCKVGMDRGESNVRVSYNRRQDKGQIKTYNIDGGVHNVTEAEVPDLVEIEVTGNYIRMENRDSARATVSVDN